MRPWYTHARSWGTLGDRDREGALRSISAIWADDNGDVWVADYGNQQMVHFRSDGQFVSKTGGPPWSAPTSITGDGSGRLYLGYRGEGRVRLLGPSRPHPAAAPVGFEFLFVWGRSMLADGMPAPHVKAEDGSYLYIAESPFDLSGMGQPAVNGGYLYAPVVSRHEILKFDDFTMGQNGWSDPTTRKGALLKRWGRLGTGDGDLRDPTAVAVADGKVHVLEYGNSRVSVFDTNGNFLRTITHDGFRGTIHELACDRYGSVYIGGVGGATSSTPLASSSPVCLIPFRMDSP